ncbi:MAG TPA: hypothetical protein VFQ44_31045 [Streptosporangiaceae bacterium]|nr:hypothetical protein [Streptosporangiaceae bacterium]
MTAGMAGCAHKGDSSAAAVPVEVTKATQAPRLHDVRIFSRTYRLSPAGPLARWQTVRLPLTRRVPPGWAVVIATAETSQGPWSYLPARLSSDRRAAIFKTPHHSVFTVIGEDVDGLLRFFKTEFLDGLSSGATASAARPQCTGQSEARSGYSIASSPGPTVFWCFGADSSGQRILRIVNNRRYPLEIQHPGLPVAERPAIDYGSLPSLAHVLSGNLSILAPGAQIGYRVSLAAGQSAGAETTVDGFGESLLALQTGINTLLAILTRFGVGGASKSVTAMNKALGDVACADAIAAAHPGSILSSCLSPKDMVDYFGTAGLLLAPLAAAGGLASFFASEFQGLHDVWTSEDRYDILMRRQVAVPVLGQLAGTFADGEGWGQARPATVFNGGDPTGLVTDITWTSWGGNTAIGTGISDYVGPNQTVAGGTQQPVTIVAFDLGTCDGKLMYQAVEWYFPQHHQSFNPRQYEDVCNGSYVGL